jgi:hypothetical protein
MATFADKKVEAVLGRLFFLRECVVEDITKYGMWSRDKFVIASFDFENDRGEYKYFREVYIPFCLMMEGELLDVAKKLVAKFENEISCLRDDWYKYWVEEGIRELIEGEEVSEEDRIKVH